jgi:hypothetical protein
MAPIGAPVSPLVSLQLQVIRELPPICFGNHVPQLLGPRTLRIGPTVHEQDSVVLHLLILPGQTFLFLPLISSIRLLRRMPRVLVWRLKSLQELLDESLGAFLFLLNFFHFISTSLTSQLTHPTDQSIIFQLWEPLFAGCCCSFALGC